MINSNSQNILEPGSYLEEKDNTFILHETSSASEFFEEMNLCEITENIEVIDFKYELIRVNSYNPELEHIEHDAITMGISVYVPQKIFICMQDEYGENGAIEYTSSIRLATDFSRCYFDERGNVQNQINEEYEDKYPTVIKIENELVFCSFRDLHYILYKVLDAKKLNRKLSTIFKFGCTKIEKAFFDLSNNTMMNVELHIYNKCRNPDLMKQVSPWIFVTELIAKSKLTEINMKDSFWGIVKSKEKSYIAFYLWGQYYAVELVKTSSVRVLSEKIPSNVKCILLPEEDYDGIGVAYRRNGEMYEIRVWIDFEKYTRKFYERFEYNSELKKEEIEDAIKQHVEYFEKEQGTLCYEIEKVVPPLLFRYDIQRIIEICRNLLTNNLLVELERQLYELK